MSLPITMTELIRTVIGTFIGVFIGGVITLWVTRRYYVRAAKDLTEKSALLLRSIELILRSLEEGDLVELTRDSDGEFKGIVLKVSAQGSGIGSASAKGEVIRQKASNEPKAGDEAK